MLEQAAVIGKEFWPSAVATLGLGRDQPLGPTLLALVRRDFVEPATSSIPGEDGFRFRHALIRDAAYTGIPKRTRADLHERFASWLELHLPREEFLGYHLEQTHRYREELAPWTTTPGRLASGLVSCSPPPESAPWLAMMCRQRSTSSSAAWRCCRKRAAREGSPCSSLRSH